MAVAAAVVAAAVDVADAVVAAVVVVAVASEINIIKKLSQISSSFLLADLNSCPSE